MNRLFSILLLAVFLMVLSVSSGYSQKVSGQFIQMDQNKDGSVSLEELQKSYPEMDEKSFKSADTNNDGKISHDEWYNFKDKPRKGQRQGQKSGKGYGQGKRTY
ncbi:hypothetical protein DSCOOX_03160 [Desulfosarcina ovata subsp. ovata]|uniref:EF-hand domain-containing protein n=2 Tax=Desulfosarcina ovata TaxID=83564 RepID=A0A5K8A3X9_9BACT|nr:hypothetical protein DSCOOX_03160 [Desulfosarcina ovata subsp. ovata]